MKHVAYIKINYDFKDNKNRDFTLELYHRDTGNWVKNYDLVTIINKHFNTRFRHYVIGDALIQEKNELFVNLNQIK
jgi:hypothetical protein